MFLNCVDVIIMKEKQVGYEKIQLVTISRPSAYGEYEPYHFTDTEEEFEKAVVNM